MKPVPILQISGLSDNIVPVDGSMTRLGGWGGTDQKPSSNFLRVESDKERGSGEAIIRATAFVTLTE